MTFDNRPRTFDIRAEFTGSRHEDFQVSALSLPDARSRAERTLGYGPKYEWRGAVVFVDHPPPFSRI